MTGKTLIVYASKSGANSDAANTIAEALKTTYSMDVTVADLKNGSPDIAPFQNIIVGSGVRATNVYKEAVEFLKQDFGDRKVALFFCCGGGGNTKTCEQSAAENARKALAKNKSLKPIDVAAFGGYMKMLGKVMFDTRDANRVRSWAIELGKKF